MDRLRAARTSYHRAPRHAGKTHWSYWRLRNFAIEGFTGFSVIPLQIATYLGSLISLGAFPLGAFIVFRTLVRGDAVPVWPSLMVAILFLGGIQLLFIGIIGEYLARVFNETKGRPLYVVESHIPSAVAAARPAAQATEPKTLRPPVAERRAGDPQDGRVRCGCHSSTAQSTERFPPHPASGNRGRAPTPKPIDGNPTSYPM